MVYIFNMSNRGTCCLSIGLLSSLFHVFRKKRLNSFNVLSNKFMDDRENKIKYLQDFRVFSFF